MGGISNKWKTITQLQPKFIELRVCRNVATASELSTNRHMKNIYRTATGREKKNRQ